MPIVASVVKRATTATSAGVDRDGGATRRDRRANAAPRPDVRRHPARRVRAGLDRDSRGRPGNAAAATSPIPTRSGASAPLVAGAERPVLLAGGDVYWAHAEEPMRAFAEAARVPVFVNGMGRGTHPRRPRARVLPSAIGRAEGSRSRARRRHAARLPARFRPVRRRAGGAPLRRAGRGRPPRGARRVDRAVTSRRLHRADRARSGTRRPRRLDRALARRRAGRRAAEQPMLTADSSPIKPGRVYGELRTRLDRDAIVIGDGGDFVSYAGKLIDSYAPGTFLDPGPFGCLGMGPGYALAAGARTTRRASGADARRRCDRVLARRLRSPRPSRRRRRRDRREQRHLGAREAPDAGALRLRRRRRSPARRALRPGDRGASAATASSCRNRTRSVPRSTARSQRPASRSSTSAPIRPTPTPAPATSGEPVWTGRWNESSERCGSRRRRTG